MPGMLGGKENRLFPPFAFAGGIGPAGFSVPWAGSWNIRPSVPAHGSAERLKSLSQSMSLTEIGFEAKFKGTST